MVLVIDVNKGIQTQTAECLVIAELLNKNLLIVLNKIDLLSDEKRVPMIEKVIATRMHSFSKFAIMIQSLVVRCDSNISANSAF
ncbi:unnamed protein product, partial [Nesidiocoris tenuis]